MNKPYFAISLVNHADPNEPSHWVQHVSRRRQRALKLARRLKKEGNTNIMLWQVSTDGTRRPVSLNWEANVKFVGAAMDAKFAKRSKHQVVGAGLVVDEMIDVYQAMLKRKALEALNRIAGIGGQDNG